MLQNLQCLLACQQHGLHSPTYYAWTRRAVSMKGISYSQARLQPWDPQAYLALFGAERSLSLRVQVILTSQHLYVLGRAWSYIFLMCLSYTYTENHYFYFYGILPFPNILVSHLAHESSSMAFKCTESQLFLSKVQNYAGGGWHRGGNSLPPSISHFQSWIDKSSNWD